MANDTANVVAFSITEDGETTGTQWHGDFKAKQRLSLRDQLNRDKVRRDLLGITGGAPDDRAMSIALILAELSVRITDAPSWWREQANGLDAEDGNVVVKVYDEAMRIEREALEARQKKASAAKEDLTKLQAEAK